ncbi:MAG: tryptophan 7-halogenase, partial [Gammaproteobacteria bacterium]|nr:tryptophan 7-halogenase [Gammaproteobacteria bacterium]
MIEPRRVVIVGNSASAWITAVCLDAVVNDGDFRPADITVVGRDEIRESPGLDATLPDLRHLVAVAGIDEAEFLKRAGGTFSHGIRFVGWRPEACWYHAFDRHRSGPIDTSGIDWLASDHGMPFAETVSAQPALCKDGIAPRPLPGVREFPRLDYGLHLDELRVAGVFRELAAARGLRHIADDCGDVERDDNGRVVALSTAGGARIEGKLFIDCTGIDAQLIGRKPGVPWVESSYSLAGDRVATIDIPYERHYP